ncbi:MAG TPA: hypothetical protein VHS31_02555 [Tepidisphaeraceae bacterium]|jgi:hypothetical protein|nr:hypothetical protein [Tepidisphaeraceae bacterium]
MGKDYIPEKDIKAACWMKRFARTLVEQPDAYRTTPEDAAEIDALVLAFRTANANCWPSAIRNRARKCTKDVARKAAEKLVRPTSQRIRTDPRIAPDLKVMIGLKPPGKRRRQIPMPQSVPILTLSAPMSGVVSIKVTDSISIRRAKPTGAKGLELWERFHPVEETNAPIANPSDGDSSKTSANAGGPGESWRYVGLYTRTPIEVHPSITKPGDGVSYVARWVTQRGEPAEFGQITAIRPVFSVTTKLGMLMQRRRRMAA